MSKYKFSGSGVAAMVALLMACCGSAVSLGQEDLALQQRWYRLVCKETGTCYNGYGSSDRPGKRGIQEACRRAYADADKKAKDDKCSDYIAVPQNEGEHDVCWTWPPPPCDNVSSSSLESKSSGWVAWAKCCSCGDLVEAMGVGKTRAKARLDARRNLRDVFNANCKLRDIHYKLTPIGSGGASSCD